MSAKTIVAPLSFGVILMFMNVSWSTCGVVAWISKDLAGRTASTSRSRADRSAQTQNVESTVFHRRSARWAEVDRVSIWERRAGNGRNVTFPARQYSVNGGRRAFALLRPIVDVAAQTRVRDLILDAYQQYEERAAAL